jgi:hypothetical protein
MPRLFTALEIPRDAALSLSLLRGGLPGARWLDVENYHITLRFIGDVDGPTADEVVNALDRVDRPSFSLVTLRHGFVWRKEAAFDLGRCVRKLGTDGIAGRNREDLPAYWSRTLIHGDSRRMSLSQGCAMHGSPMWFPISRAAATFAPSPLMWGVLW